MAALGPEHPPRGPYIAIVYERGLKALRRKDKELLSRYLGTLAGYIK